jgi:hypothetical protein
MALAPAGAFLMLELVLPSTRKEKFAFPNS